MCWLQCTVDLYYLLAWQIQVLYCLFTNICCWVPSLCLPGAAMTECALRPGKYCLSGQKNWFLFELPCCFVYEVKHIFLFELEVSSSSIWFCLSGKKNIQWDFLSVCPGPPHCDRGVHYVQRNSCSRFKNYYSGLPSCSLKTHSKVMKMTSNQIRFLSFNHFSDGCVIG